MASFFQNALGGVKWNLCLHIRLHRGCAKDVGNLANIWLAVFFLAYVSSPPQKTTTSLSMLSTVLFCFCLFVDHEVQDEEN